MKILNKLMEESDFDFMTRHRKERENEEKIKYDVPLYVNTVKISDVKGLPYPQWSENYDDNKLIDIVIIKNPNYQIHKSDEFVIKFKDPETNEIIGSYGSIPSLPTGKTLKLSGVKNESGQEDPSSTKWSTYYVHQIKVNK